MNQQVTTAIILTRTDYGEADRILTVLTPDYGKLRLLAKGVRRIKSKLAGGIELFSVSTITFVRGRGEIGTLVSTRLNKHFIHIVSDLQRTMLGYELIKQLNKATEDEPEPAYFELLQQVFAALDNPNLPLDLIRFWFSAQLLRLNGHGPNLQTEDRGQPLDANSTYNFNFENVAFTEAPAGRFAADHIKFLRLVFSPQPPKVLAAVQGSAQLVQSLTPLIQTMLAHHLRL